MYAILPTLVLATTVSLSPSPTIPATQWGDGLSSAHQWEGSPYCPVIEWGADLTNRAAWDILLERGWHGHAWDGTEAIYPPYC